MSRTPPRSLRGLSILVPLALVLAATTSFLVLPGSAIATEEDENDPAVLRATWQGRYRALLHDRARFSAAIEISEKNYTMAQRRNYPRGGAREQFRIDAVNAREKLAETEEKIAKVFDQARDAGVPPGWLYDVEEEPIDATARPASPRPADSDELSEEDLEGRNPLYLNDDARADDNTP